MSTGTYVAREALEKLLSFATKRVCAERRGIPLESPATLHLSKSKFPKYEQLPTAADLREFSSVIDAARAAGAVTVEIGDAEASTPRLYRIDCISAAKLAVFLGVKPYWEIVSSAEERLLPSYSRWPVLRDIVNAWWEQRTPQGLKPDEIQALLDSMRTIEHGQDKDVPARRLSAQLFGNSKRVERLTREIDILHSGSLDGERREPAQVLADLGIVKFPQIVLMSNADLFMKNGAKLQIEWPFLGTAPDAIDYAALASGVSVLITIENLTTFNEISRADLKATSHVAALYTGGAPSPSLMAFYTRTLAQLATNIDVVHWGDVDLGGYRIAAKFAEACTKVGRHLNLWQMPPMQLSSNYRANAIDKNDLRQIQVITERWRWPDPGEYEIEQEALEPIVPPTAQIL